MMNPMDVGFANLPQEAYEKFSLAVGATYEYGDWTPKAWFYIIVLIATGLIFYLMAILNMTRKNKRY